jgi:hypothetical protein
MNERSERVALPARERKRAGGRWGRGAQPPRGTGVVIGMHP